jgi:hypothetical protein
MTIDYDQKSLENKTERKHDVQSYFSFENTQTDKNKMETT